MSPECVGFLSYQYVELRSEQNPFPSCLSYGDVECEDTDTEISYSDFSIITC
jgi:hypothetical protein